MNAVVLLGAPGSGKGTVAAHLRRALGLRPFSTGLRIRQEMDNPDSALGARFRPLIERGDFIPDALALDLVGEVLSRADAAGADWVFDGFPRTAAQARACDSLLANWGGGVVAALLLEAPGAILRERLDGRLVCAGCGQVHHRVHCPPRSEGRCDACGSPLTFRPDDRGELAGERLRLYPERARGLAEHYQAGGRLDRIDAGQPLASVCAEAERAARRRLA